ncbi:MAG: UbiA prenyltransferase family protein [candidate division WWE3 bacterium]|nr:UbiA prenyltransferase family protein [candidate division WWE3 bacterium]
MVNLLRKILTRIKTLHNSPYYKILRVRQWLKNGSLFLAIVFGGRLFDLHYFGRVALGAIVFCVLSSGIYVLNDLIDAPNDRLHPIKKNRPIAAGKISLQNAQIMFIILTLTALTAALFLDKGFFMMAVVYTLMMTAYDLWLKKLPVIDVLTLSGGYVLRVFAGSFIADTSISALLILTTIFTALFISFAKRRAEVNLIEAETTQQMSATRKVLKDYPAFLIDKYLTLTFGAAFITYSFYTYSAGIRQFSKTLSTVLPTTLSRPNWLMLTIPIVFYALARYMYLIYERKEGEYPENTLITDKTLFATAALWLAMIIFIIYGIPLI